MLLKIAREHNSVVAVVGKGHLPGIKKNWQQPIEVRLGYPLLCIVKCVETELDLVKCVETELDLVFLST